MFLIEDRRKAAPLWSGASGQDWHIVACGWGGVPDLILVTDPTEAAAVRACGTPRAAAPIVLIASGAVPVPPGVDEVVVPPADDAEVRAILDRWRPVEPGALDRIEATFGMQTVRDLLQRLRRQLEAALDGGSEEAARGAHRLAGIAGMLGFAALGEAWLAVERGAPDAQRTARIESRRALAAIARRTG